MNNSDTDGFGNLNADKKNGGEIEECRPKDGVAGGSTLVETTVEIEFAESWKPLRKSNTRAMRTRMITKAIESAMF